MDAAKISRIIFHTYGITPAKDTSFISVASSSIVNSPLSSFPKLISEKCHSASAKAATALPKHVYPDPIPEFAEAETLKFKAELVKKLSRDEEEFGGDLLKVVDVCSERCEHSGGVLLPRATLLKYSIRSCPHYRYQFVIGNCITKKDPVYGFNQRMIFREFLHKEYGGPGTLLVEPFTDMLVALKKKKLPGAPVAARASLLWAQNYVDQDWEDWNSKANK